MEFENDLNVTTNYALSLPENIRFDEKTFEEFYIQFKRPVFLLALSILRDYGLAEDAMQETFLKVKEKAIDYHTIKNPKSWILTVTHNISVNILRKRSRELIDFEMLELIEAPENNYQSTIDFNKVLKQLSDIERSIVMFRILGMKFKEIANFFGISASDARMRYSRALNKLKVYFREEDI